MLLFCNLLAADIFKTVKLVNDERSGSSLNTVAMSLHNVHVKELHFIGSALGDVHRKQAAFSDTERILPRGVDALLCNLRQFPSLERLSIKFDYQFENMDEWTEGVGLVEEETLEQVLEAEASEAWRALMSRTYTALTQNNSPHFKLLEIRQLIWKSVSTFSHPAFHDFLGRLEQLTLSLYGEDHGAVWSSVMSPRYRAFMPKLDNYFFEHLANVTNLAVKAPEKGRLGTKGPYADIPFTLKADRMPLLKTLQLVYIFACEELISFLVGHKDTLEEVTLRNCYACLIDWSQLFSSLFSACPTRLRRFELVNSEIPLPISQYFSDKEDEKVRAIQGRDPGRIIFPYAGVNHWCGWLWYDFEKMFAAFLQGEDQRSWTRLTKLMEINAKSEASGVNLQVQS